MGLVGCTRELHRTRYCVPGQCAVEASFQFESSSWHILINIQVCQFDTHFEPLAVVSALSVTVMGVPARVASERAVHCGLGCHAQQHEESPLRTRVQQLVLRRLQRCLRRLKLLVSLPGLKSTFALSRVLVCRAV